jgi:hypothetical protein
MLILSPQSPLQQSRKWLQQIMNGKIFLCGHSSAGLWAKLSSQLTNLARSHCPHKLHLTKNQLPTTAALRSVIPILASGEGELALI